MGEGKVILGFPGIFGIFGLGYGVRLKVGDVPSAQVQTKSHPTPPRQHKLTPSLPIKFAFLSNSQPHLILPRFAASWSPPSCHSRGHSAGVLLPGSQHCQYYLKRSLYNPSSQKV